MDNGTSLDFLGFSLAQLVRVEQLLLKEGLAETPFARMYKRAMTEAPSGLLLEIASSLIMEGVDSAGDRALELLQQVGQINSDGVVDTLEWWLRDEHAAPDHVEAILAWATHLEWMAVSDCARVILASPYAKTRAERGR